MPFVSLIDSGCLFRLQAGFSNLVGAGHRCGRHAKRLPGGFSTSDVNISRFDFISRSPVGSGTMSNMVVSFLLSLLIKLQKGRLTVLVHGSFSGRGVGDRQLNNRSVTLMPFKHNAARCHRIGRMKFKVTNWPEYEAGLRRRGSLTLWLTPEARAMWLAPRRTTRGGQPRYSDLVSRPVLD